MYCIKCGVKLAATETKCPLCETKVYCPEFVAAEPLYPDRQPKRSSVRRVLCGAVLILCGIPLLTCFFSDLLINGSLDWFGYVAGALLVLYVSLALPFWFKRPNPVIFVPCAMAAAVLYLGYIWLETGGKWFFLFALPIALCLMLIGSAFTALVHYLRRGRLYIFGGTTMALGAVVLLTEHLLTVTFGLPFVGWSVYPFTVLLLLGGLLIYLAIHADAREAFVRKLFF